VDIQETNIVCFGGGTGMPALLSGLKHNPFFRISAIVNMFDSGGSSGELRDRFGILPPGDVLKCLLALSEEEKFARRIFLKRIHHAQFPGHTGGNALLFGLEKIYGDYSSAVDALGQILSIHGKIIPVTQEKTTLCARFHDGSTCEGETEVDQRIREGQGVERLFLQPDVDASPAALAAIQQADLICIGPGSFYTSVLSNFLPRGVQEAVSVSKAIVIFIANFLTEGNGMKGLLLPDIVRVVETHIGRTVNHIIVNNRWPAHLLSVYAAQEKYPIVSEEWNDRRVVRAPLWQDDAIARHDSARLMGLVSRLVI
jgi:uncharacterized cofD-like protein